MSHLNNGLFYSSGDWFCTHKNPLHTPEPRTPKTMTRLCTSPLPPQCGRLPQGLSLVQQVRPLPTPWRRAHGHHVVTFSPVRCGRRGARACDRGTCAVLDARASLVTRRGTLRSGRVRTQRTPGAETHAATRRLGGRGRRGAAAKEGAGAQRRTRPRDDRGGRRLLSKRGRADVGGCRRGRRRRSTDVPADDAAWGRGSARGAGGGRGGL